MTVNVENGLKKKKRIFYFDALRALAIISVILFHVFMECRGFVASQYATFPSISWCVTDILGACFRCGVDLFLMLSGALSLGRVWDIKSFLGKRLPRIVSPFVFWGVVLSLLLVGISMFWPNFWHTIDSFNLSNFLNYLYGSFMSKNPGFTQFWFFWMILGTYLIMPIFNKWLLHSDLKEAEYFLIIWLITCLFDNTLGIKFPVKLTYFAGPIGMVVLGYYLRHTQRKIFNNPYWSLIILLIGAISLIVVSYLSSTTSEIVFIDRYSFLYAIEVTGIFTLFKNFSKFKYININFFKNPNGIFRKSMFSIAKYSYGIYLIHRAILVLLVAIFATKLHQIPLIIILFVGTLLLSWLILAILNRVPYINQVIGAK